MAAELVENSLLRWIPAAPLLTAALIGIAISVVRRPMARPLVVAASCTSILTSLALSGAAFADLIVQADRSGDGVRVMLDDTLHTWVGVGVGSSAFSADLAFRFDALSAVMCLLVTGVAFLVHIYSVGSMTGDQRDDGGLARYFVYMNLATGAMLLLVLADNPLLMFVGWHGVALSFYLLIGFWYSDSDNAYAGGKEFVVNRIGDCGLLLGILLLFWATADAGVPAVSFRALEANFAAIASQTVQLPGWLGGAVWALPSLIGLCFLVAAVARAAQLPMYVWLPEASVGPTPAAALLHAATMLAAGVYLLARLSFLFAASPAVLAGISWVGASTALLAAGLACVQTDIKKVLAYASVSQLGIMFMAAGAGAFGIAIFHLLSHAFGIAILFLGAGVVVDALDGGRDLFGMGGLRSRLKRTWWVMLVGCATLAGLPPLSGFFSGNEILARVLVAEELPGRDALYWVGLVAVGLTAFAISRLFMLIFHGKSKLPRRRRVALQDPGDLLMGPLYVLAALALLGGLLGVPQFWGDRMGIEESDSLGNFLSGVLTAAPSASADVLAASTAVLGASTDVLVVIGRSLAATGLGFGAAYLLYVTRPRLPDKLSRLLSVLYRPLTRKHWVDELYDLLLVRSLLRFSDRVVFRRIEIGLIDGALVGGAAVTVRALASHGMKYFQSGLTQGYLLVMVAGALGMLVYLAG